MAPGEQLIVWPGDPGADDPAVVGPKLAATVAIARLVEEHHARTSSPSGRPAVRVPEGFTITTAAGRAVLASADLVARVSAALEDLDRDATSVHVAGAAAREAVLAATLPDTLVRELRASFAQLERRHEDRHGPGTPMLLAVRSSAAAEDLPGASFAGQYDTHLGVHGPDQLLDAYLAVLASFYSDRAISYRQEMGLDPHPLSGRSVAGRSLAGRSMAGFSMAVGVQVLVRADLGGSAGVLFSRDPADPTLDRTLIEATSGLGDGLVSGTVDPERHLVGPIDTRADATGPEATSAGAAGHADTVELPDGVTEGVLRFDQVQVLASWGRRLESAWGAPVDVEWAIDGRTDEVVLVQCRPLTALGRAAHTGDAAGSAPTGRASGDRASGDRASGDRASGDRASGDSASGDRASSRGVQFATGLAVGTGTTGGVARRLEDPLDAEAFSDGDVLVTATTDPGWLPLMRRAAAIVTDHGGRTSHAAIVSRELGLLAVVGCGDATRTVPDGHSLEIVCMSNGLGVVYGAGASGDKSSPAGGVTVP